MGHIHKKHAQQAQGQGQREGQQGAAAQVRVALLLPLAGGVFFGRGVGQQQVVAHALQGFFQGFGADLLRIILHLDGFGGEIDSRSADAVLAFQDRFDADGASGATHFGNGKLPADNR